LDETLRNNKSELLYAIKAGRRDKIISRLVPIMTHPVFPTTPWELMAIVMHLFQSA
jgi:antitoxin (DNA-binding transcriptional repressor) of toxin-antitoxin stability system